MDSARQAVLQYVMGRQLVSDSDLNHVIVAAHAVAQGEQVEALQLPSRSSSQTNDLHSPIWYHWQLNSHIVPA